MRSAKQNLRLKLVPALSLLVAFGSGAAAQGPADDARTAGPQTGAINGRVINENGQPLPYASVNVRGSIPLTQGRSTMTDNEGNFQVSGLDAAAYVVTAFAPAYTSPIRDPESAPSYYRIGDSVTISLIRGGVITGTVLSASGEPLVQISVRATLIRDANGRPARFPVYPFERTTDDRGIYRLYGLVPGTYLVSAGGRGAFTYLSNAYDSDAPTYAPSAPRDTAAEITVRPGEETSGVDIRYRGDRGAVISGTVSTPASATASYSGINITLLQISNGVPQGSTYTFQPPGRKGFEFYGVADGVYDLVAQSSLGPGETAVSEPRRITVKGANVSGISLITKPLGSISGRIALQPSSTSECQGKRPPLFAETLVAARRSEKPGTNSEPGFFPFAFFGSQGAPNKSGDFLLRNTVPGRYSLNAQFFARYWYLQSITQPAPAAPVTGGRSASASKPVDAAKNWISLAFDERITGVTITLAEGAASLRGSIKPGEGEKIPAKLTLILVPAEKEKAEDVLRFFAAPVSSDGTFVLGNLPPGRYWALAWVAAGNDVNSTTNLRAPDEAQTRARLRRDAEANKASLELKPCQNLIGYDLPLSTVAP